MEVAELAGWLSKSMFDRAFATQQAVVRSDSKLKWSMQETLRAPELFRTKKEAEDRLGARKEELEAAGLTVVGSKTRGSFMYGLEETFVGAVTIFGRAKTPQKGD